MIRHTSFYSLWREMCCGTFGKKPAVPARRFYSLWREMCCGTEPPAVKSTPGSSFYSLWREMCCGTSDSGWYHVQPDVSIRYGARCAAEQERRGQCAVRNVSIRYGARCAAEPPKKGGVMPFSFLFAMARDVLRNPCGRIAV